MGKNDAAKHPLVMIRIKDFKSANDSTPNISSTLGTCAAIVPFLIGTEMLMRIFFFNIKHLHPLFELQINRYILSRHLGVDTFSCFVVATLGWRARHLAMDLVDAAFGKPGAMPAAGAEGRMFTYQPESFRIGVFFFAYQIKNLYDTIVWNDGPEFIFHHVLSMSVAWGSLHPGVAQFYGPFFLGFSEVSTAILCVLANFDPVHGVIGLGEAFPIPKVIIGVVFVVFFILCRTIMWPVASYYFVKDCRVLLAGDSTKLVGRAGWIKLFMGCLVGLSVLQVAWLVQIYILAIQEFKAIGLI